MGVRESSESRITPEESSMSMSVVKWRRFGEEQKRMAFSDSFLHWMSTAFSKLSLSLVGLNQDLICRQKQYLKHFKIFTGLLGLLRNAIKYRLAAIVKSKIMNFSFLLRALLYHLDEAGGEKVLQLQITFSKANFKGEVHSTLSVASQNVFVLVLPLKILMFC